MIPLFEMSANQEDVDAVTAVIKRCSQWAGGPETEEFEDQLAKYNQTEYAVVFSNGTTALDAMIKAHKIGRGANVVVPSFTFVSTVNSLLFNDIKPKFCDIEYDTYALDIEQIKEKIDTDTAGVTLVHYAGCPAKYTKEIKELCEDERIYFFEDNAEAMGAHIKGKRTGSFGDSAMLSFCQNKIITTGEGGAVLTDDRDIHRKLRLIRSHGQIGRDYVQLGYNYRMPSMCAALGISQLDRVKQFISCRRIIAENYCHRIDKRIKMPMPNHKWGFMHVYQMFPILLESEQQRKNVIEHLTSKEVSCKGYFDPPIHMSNFYKSKYGKEKLPVTNDVSKRILCLPMYTDLQLKDLSYICRLINEAL